MFPHSHCIVIVIIIITILLVVVIIRIIIPFAFDNIILIKFSLLAEKFATVGWSWPYIVLVSNQPFGEGAF